MMICRDRKLLFVHLQKTGGMSVRVLLRRVVGMTKFGPRHASLRRARRRLGSAFADYYSFSFVRNPWDRLVSLYEYRRKKGRTRRRKGRLRGIPGEISFDEFAQRWRGPSQAAALCDASGTLLVCEVYRFERFAEECNRLLAHIGLPPAEIPHRNFTRHGHYSTYYDSALRGVVGEQYARDIAVFGYKFETNP
jgi:hypothetical protein